MMSRSKQTAANAVFGFVSTVGAQAAMLVVQPFFIWHLGVERYGIWALFTAMTRYSRITDLLALPATKFIAEYHERGDTGRVRQIVTFALSFYVLLTLAFTALAALAAPVLLPFFRTTEPGTDALFTGSVAYMFLMMTIQAFAALLNGLGYLRMSAFSGAVGQIVFASAGAIMVAGGFGLRGLLIAAFLQVAVSGILLFVLGWRFFGGPIVSNPFRLDWSVIRPLFTIGGWLQISTLSELVGSETDQLIIAHFMGPSAVGLYEIGSKIARAVRVVAYYLGSALLPTFAKIGIHRTDLEMTTVAIRTTRLASLMIFAIAGFVFATGPQIMRVYVGDIANMATASSVLRILSIAYVCESLAMVPITLLRAAGRTKLEGLTSIVAMIANVSFTVVLTPRFGISGVLAGTLLGSITAETILIVGYHRIQHLNLWRAYLVWFVPLLIGTSAVTAGSLLLFNRVGTLGANRVGIAAELIPMFCLYGIAYLSMLSVGRIVRTEDVAQLARAIPGRLGALLQHRFIGRAFRTRAPEPRNSSV
jgi:O-antigen/teichoic acid export membrane protein